jgi:hypothetical protein
MLLADVSRSLFAKDKFLFISAAAFAILGQDCTISNAELSALLCGPPLAAGAASKPEALGWLAARSWEELAVGGGDVDGIGFVSVHYFAGGVGGVV